MSENTNVPPQGNRDTNVREYMQGLARGIDEMLPQGWGFFLCTFPFNDGEGRVNYVANARREDVLKMLRNLVRQLETKPEGFARHTDDVV